MYHYCINRLFSPCVLVTVFGIIILITLTKHSTKQKWYQKCITVKGHLISVKWSYMCVLIHNYCFLQKHVFYCTVITAASLATHVPKLHGNWILSFSEMSIMHLGSYANKYLNMPARTVLRMPSRLNFFRYSKMNHWNLPFLFPIFFLVIIILGIFFFIWQQITCWSSNIIALNFP